MDQQNVKHNGIKQLRFGPAFQWGLAVFLAAGLGAALGYCWRVFFYLDSRWPAAWSMLGCAGLGVLLVALAALVRFGGRDFAARGALCVALCGALFVFADPPLQPPDESSHYLRTYAISRGRLDFDAARAYPADVAALCEAFPAAWVNAHTSVGVGTDPITGGPRPYDTAGYALKQYGDDAPIESITASFAEYFALRAGGAAEVTEPLNFLILPFLPGALGMLLARLLGLGALGCLYAGRLGNLAAYAALCWLALRQAQRCRGLLLAFMLLPLSLYMAASLSYDATLLGGYYLMLALLTRRAWTGRTALAWLAACLYVNVGKPYLNLLWALLPLLLPRGAWRLPPLGGSGRRPGRAALVLAALAGALAVTFFVEWYGSPAASPFCHNYPAFIPRQGGEAVDGMGQLAFIFSNPLRYVAVALGTLYENAFFAGQLGVFGALDLPVPLLNLTGPLALLAGALLSAGPGEGLGARRTLGAGALGIVYAAGAMTAMYITYTPVGMVRIVGLQARYFLPVLLALGFGAAALLRRALRPAPGTGKAETFALPLFGGYAAVGALLLFQHYFIGPFYTIPV